AGVGAPLQHRALVRPPRRGRHEALDGRRHGARNRAFRPPEAGVPAAVRQRDRSPGAMTFEWPFALVLLVFVPLLALLYISVQRRRNRYALRYASVSLVAQAVGKGPGIKRHIPPALYLMAITAMIFALARPEATIPIPQ